MSDSKFLSGEKVYLRALTREDLSGPMLSWTDDNDVTKYMYRGWRPARIEELENDFDATINSSNNIEFAICDQSTNTHIGVAGLHEIEWLARHAEFRIMIGDKAYWGKGCGAEVARLILYYAFEKLNMNRVSLGVNAADERAIQCYKKSGFTQEGIAREVIYRNNQYYDAVYMSILRSEYNALKK